MKRRQFFSSGALLASMPLLAGDFSNAFSTERIAEILQDAPSQEIADPAAFRYWMTANKRLHPYEEPKVWKAEEGATTKGRETNAVGNQKIDTSNTAGRIRDMKMIGNIAGGVQLPTLDAKKPKFIIYTREHGFRDVNKIQDDELLEKGDVDVSILVNTLRPSVEDIGVVEGAVGGSLKLDFGQKESPPLPPLQNALAWSSIGVLSATSIGKKLPKLESLKLESSAGTLFGTVQTVPLVGGSGQWKWSFYVQKKESTWLKALKFIGSLGGIAGAATPAVFAALGLPAIAWAALSNVDKLYAYLHAKEVTSDWLFQGLQTPVVATRDARGLGAVPLRKGRNQYLVIPARDGISLDYHKSELKVSDDGFLLPKELPDDSLGAASEAGKTATDVTYISMTVDVKSRLKTIA